MKTTHTRTREQHMADVAAATLHRLDILVEELEALHFQLMMLGDFTHDTDTDLAHALMNAAFAAQVIGSEQVNELVERVAATLPVRPAEGWSAA
ncbi:hypothetical protein GWR20_21280 [Mycolicibacter kumamotonensis]|uniref:ANTAR domain-containing protein n=1 Tax=Mycolicibacter kumamotonensis TaxID=354243 RepID=A0A7K3LH38_9MYCO|nr:hypothetical protein [Mycolicibacter kumamotonensis]